MTERNRRKGYFDRDSFLYIFKPGHIDLSFVITVAVILTFGLIMMFSASVASGTKLFKTQVIYAFVGLVLMFAASQVDLVKIEKDVHGLLTAVIYLGCMFLMVMAFFLPGDVQAGFHRILKIGPIRFQPSEFMKIALILMLAKILTYFQGELLHKEPIHFRRFDTPARTPVGSAFRAVVNFVFQQDLRVMILLLAVIFLPALIVQRSNHNSGAIILGLIGVCMMYSGNVKLRYFGYVFTVIAVAIAALIVIHQSAPDLFAKIDSKQRIDAWLSKDYTSTDDNRWQVNNGLYAIGSGGFFGVGFNKSVQKYYYVPEPQNDMIFAILCEEFGFFGAALVLFAFGMYLCLCANIGRKAKSKFQKFLVYGVAAHIGLQVVMNVAVVTEVIPLTGVELPFFSSGGSALLANLVESGLVLAVSKSNPQPRAAR